jgi:hypothetical protein
LQSEIGQQVPKPLQGSIGLFPRSTHHHDVIGLCRVPGYAERRESLLVRVAAGVVCAA